MCSVAVLQCRLALSHRWKVFNIVIPGPHYTILLFFAIHNCHQTRRSLCPGQKSSQVTTIQVPRSGDMPQDWTHQRQKTLNVFFDMPDFLCRRTHQSADLWLLYSTRRTAVSLDPQRQWTSAQTSAEIVSCDPGIWISFFFLWQKKRFSVEDFQNLLCLSQAFWGKGTTFCPACGREAGLGSLLNILIASLSHRVGP